MSEKFTASNGSQVFLEDGVLFIGDPPLALTKFGVDTLREFFLHERDQELDRWRFNDYLVVYLVSRHQPYMRVEAGRTVHVLDERNGRFYERHEYSGPHRTSNEEASVAAEAYFAAHPKPHRPWHDAKPGEVWVFEWACDQEVAKLEPAGVWRKFDGESISSGDLSYVQAARRIWPAVSGDA